MLLAAAAALAAYAGKGNAAPGNLATAADWQGVIASLFPHENIDAARYAIPAAALLAAGAQDPAVAGMLSDGWRRLNQASTRAWADATAEMRTQALAQCVGSPFFMLLRRITVFTFYDNAQVWAACGYEGDAWSRGGYAGPGLVTVDWLSADAEAGSR